MNFGKKVKCEVCGTRNWSGKEYCERCSGKLDFDNIINMAEKLKKQIA
jgi:uncharacterized OB-fold protein